MADLEHQNATLRHLLDLQMNITRNQAHEIETLRARLRDVEMAWRGLGERSRKLKTRESEERIEAARIAQRKLSPDVRKR